MHRAAKWLLERLGYVPAEVRQGISLLPGMHWEISPPPAGAFPSFLRTLAEVMPEGSVLFLEGHPTWKVRLYLTAHAAERVTAVARAMFWRRPSVFHLPVTRENLEGLAALAARAPARELARHLHVYQGERVLLEWYDVPVGLFRMSRDFPAGKVKHVCARFDLRCTIGRSRSDMPHRKGPLG